jgi:hypothetical protein
MAEVLIHQIVHALINEVWSSWDKFGDIYKFNPSLSGSFHLDGTPATGIGAERECTMKDGKNYIRERIVEYVPERRMVIDIFDTSLPLKSARASFLLNPKGASHTEVIMKMEFEPSMGIFGKLMIPVMKPVFRRMLGKLLKGNSDYVEKGETVLAVA